MTQEMSFFIYLLENYTQYKQMNTADVLDRWNNAGIVPYIYDMYQQYHSEAIENAFDDIDNKLCQTDRSKPSSV